MEDKEGTEHNEYEVKVLSIVSVTISPTLAKRLYCCSITVVLKV